MRMQTVLKYFFVIYFKYVKEINVLAPARMRGPK